MMGKEFTKKTILPILLLAAWAWIAYYFCNIGGTVGVWAMNIIVGCLIGEVVVVWYILCAVFILVKCFMSVLK